MTIAARFGPLITASLLCVSCDRAAIEPSQSLVGAKQLPSAKILSRETIFISRGLGNAPESLSYELRPDDTLIVTRAVRQGSAEQSVQGKEIFRLGPKVGEQVRRALWRLRPATLKGIEWVTLPTGCRSQLNDPPESSVLFIAEGPKPGVEDDAVGLSTLPYPDSCNNRQAVQARNLLRRVLGSLPNSKMAAEFERSVKGP